MLILKIAYSYHPNSKYPLEEARIRWVLNAFLELKDHLILITTWKGIHSGLSVARLGDVPRWLDQDCLNKYYECLLNVCSNK